MTNERAIIIRPMTAAIIWFLASATLCLSPPDVIHCKAPITIYRSAAKKAMIIIKATKNPTIAPMLVSGETAVPVGTLTPTSIVSPKTGNASAE